MFKFFLNFIDLPQIGLVEIEEPFGFDGATHEIKQDANKHARNVIIANADIKLEFTRHNFKQYDYLDFELERKGWEIDIEFILQKENVTFSTGIIDGLTAQRFRDSIEFNIIQNTTFEFIKKNESIEINAFSDKSLKGETIVPCQTQNIFLKAKPIYQTSKWDSKNIQFFSSAFIVPININTTVIKPEVTIIPIVNNLLIYEIKKSLAPYDDRVVAYDIPYTFANYKNALIPNVLINSTFNLSKVKVLCKNINIKITSFNLNNTNPLRVKLILYEFILDNLQNVIVLNEFIIRDYIVTAVSNSTSDFIINENFEYIKEFENLSSGTNLGVYLIAEQISITQQTNANRTSYITFSCEGVEITATSTAFNSIIKGVRLHDLLEHQAKSMGTNLIDNVFLNNEYKDNFVMNGRMLANLNDLPFNNDFKNTFESVCVESASDYQITNAGIEILPFTDYYKNIEIGEFTELPDSNGEVTINNELSINAIEIGFKKSSFEKSGNKENTDDDVHTKLQAKFESNKADATYKREISHIRSAYIIEEQRIKGNEVEEKTTTLENDENLVIIDCVPTPISLQNNINAFLPYKITNNILEILSNGFINWRNQGLIIGQQITENGNLCQVTNIEDFKLTLLKLVPPFFTGTGEGTFTIVYTLQGVAYTNRTNEGFTEIKGVRNGDNYSNLQFSLKRILQKYNKWWGSAGQYLSNKKLNVTEIKVNNKLETRLINESTNVIDFAPIELTNNFINDRLLNGNVHKLKVFASFEKATQLFTDIKEIKGFVKINTLNNQIIKGFIKDANYRWRTQELVLTLQEMKDNKIINLTEIKDNIKNFNVIDGFVYVYDFDNILMFKPKLHTSYSIGGVVYENLNDFENNFINLIN
jgi:hypothetical protein